MLAVTCILLLMLLVEQQVAAASALVRCAAWGDPHVTRFPMNETDSPKEEWCQQTGLLWLVKNKYILSNILVVPRTYFIMDFNFVWLDDDGMILCTMNGKHVTNGCLPNCGADIQVSMADRTATVTYKKVNIVAVINLDYVSPPTFSIWIYQDPCLAKVSDGICKTGCGAVVNTCNTITQTPVQAPRPVQPTNTQNQVQTGAAKLCAVYIQKIAAALNIKQDDKNSIHATELKNAETACITDVKVTGDIHAANCSVQGLAIYKLTANASSTDHFHYVLANDLHRTLSWSKNACREAAQEVHRTILSSNTTVPLRSSFTDIHPNAKWIQNGVTVAGGNGFGNGINQLSKLRGLYVDDEQTIYATDNNNDRIVEWKVRATSGRVVAGGNGKGKETNQLNNPFDVIVDKKRDSLVICDHDNRRVVRWPRRNGTSGETIIWNISCRGLTMDENGSLVVGDYGKDEVRRYGTGDTKGTLVAGGNGRGSRLDQLESPQYVFFDRDHSVYVSDYHNHRVMKWKEGAKGGIVVAGGQGSGSSLSQLYHPRGVVVDQLGTVYVVDQGNNRIMRWRKGETQGNVIAGGNGEGGQSNQLNYPYGLSFDRQGNLYVADNENDRVQKFNIEQTTNE